MNNLKTNLQKLKPSLTINIETAHQISPSIIRVVASFNQVPTKQELAKVLQQKFPELKPMENSFVLNETATIKPLVSGYLTIKEETKPYNTESVSGLVEMASSVYLDEIDNSIWQVKGDSLVKKHMDNEDLSELVEIANIQADTVERNKKHSILASVASEYDPKNTQVLAYVDVDENKVICGVRIDDDHVYNPVLGYKEIAHDMIVSSNQLYGQDYKENIPYVAGDRDSLIDYYTRVYEYDPAYMQSVHDIVLNRSYY